jgi:threonine dehydrogenase-like Zn-dependent dehydrogenase
VLYAFQNDFSDGNSPFAGLVFDAAGTSVTNERHLLILRKAGNTMGQPTLIVTGGGGFIGSCLVRHLLSQNAGKIVACDISSNTTNLTDVLDCVEFSRADEAAAAV